MRCEHGFYRKQIPCPVCDADRCVHETRDGIKPKPRNAPSFCLTTGVVLGGATVVRRLDHNRVEMLCRCGAVYPISRSAVGRHHRVGTVSMCAPCQRRATVLRLEARRAG